MRLAAGGGRRGVRSSQEIEKLQAGLPQSLPGRLGADVRSERMSMTSTQLRDLEEGSMQDLHSLPFFQSQPAARPPETRTTPSPKAPPTSTATEATTATKTSTAATTSTTRVTASPRFGTERTLSSPLPSAKKRLAAVTRQNSAGSLPPFPLASSNSEKELKFAPLPNNQRSEVDRGGRPPLKKAESSATAADLSTSSGMEGDDVVVMDKRTGKLIQPSQRHFRSSGDLGSAPDHYLHHQYYNDSHGTFNLCSWVNWRIYRILATTGVGLFAISAGVSGIFESLSQEDEGENEDMGAQPDGEGPIPSSSQQAMGNAGQSESFPQTETTPSDPFFGDFQLIYFLSSLAIVCSGVLALGSFVIISRLRKLASILQLSIICHLFFFLMVTVIHNESDGLFDLESACGWCVPLNAAGILLTVASYGYWCHEIQTENIHRKSSARRDTKQTKDMVCDDEDDDESSTADDNDIMRPGRKGLRRVRCHDSGASVDSVDLEVGGPGGDCGGSEALAAADRNRRANSSSFDRILSPLGATLTFDGSRRARSRSSDLINDDLVDGGVGDFDEAGSGTFSHTSHLTHDQDIISSGEWEFMKAQIEERSRMQSAAVMAAMRDGSQRNLSGCSDIDPVAMPTFGAGGTRSNRATGGSGVDDDDDSMEAPQVEWDPSDDDDDSMAAPELSPGDKNARLAQHRRQQKQRDLSAFMTPGPSLPFSGSHYPEYSGMQLEVIKALISEVDVEISKAETAAMSQSRPPQCRQRPRNEIVGEVLPFSGEKSSHVQRQLTGTTHLSSDSDGTRTGSGPTASDPGMNSLTSVLTDDLAANQGFGAVGELSEQDTSWNNNLSSKLLRGARLCRDDADAGLIRAGEAADLVEEKIIPVHNRLTNTVFVKMHRGELHTIAADLRSPRRRELARQRGQVRPPHLILS